MGSPIGRDPATGSSQRREGARVFPTVQPGSVTTEPASPAPDTSTTVTDSSIVVRATLDAPPGAVFALLDDPARHPHLDGSGMVVGALDPRRLTTVGQTFVMAMHQAREGLGDYRTENTVTDLVPGARIAWTTARVGNPPAGVRWEWDVAPTAGGGTEVTHTYDWSQVTDPAVLARVSFPRVSADQLAKTVRRLAAALA